LAPGDYSISIMDWGGGGSAVQNLVIENGDKVAAGTTGLQLRATKGLTITGTVVDEGNVAQKNTRLSANPKAGGRGRSARTNDDGTFEITGLAAGALYTVTANAPGRPAVRV